MSQVPTNLPDSASISTAQWPNEVHDNSIFTSQYALSSQHQLQNDYLTNWTASKFPVTYPQTMPFLPTCQFGNVETQEQLIRKRAASSSDEGEDEENQSPPLKTPKQDEKESKYIELGSQYAGNYLPQTSVSPVAHSTPRAPYTYLSQNFNANPSYSFGMLQNCNPTFQTQFPLMNHPFYNPYNHSYSSSMQSISHVGSLDSSPHLQGTTSSFDSGLPEQPSEGSLQFKVTDSEEQKDFQVPGRLALLNANKKYHITVGELLRRIGPPENMNKSLVGAFLRKAKNRDGGKKLRENLSHYGIHLTDGRRRSLENTAFTALCEGEAIKLANDFEEVLETYFPSNLVLMEIALTIQRNITQSTQSTQNFFQLIEAIENSDADEDQQVDYIVELLVLIMGTICSVLERDRSLPDMGIKHPKFKNGAHPLPTELQRRLTEFNLVTHNFGVLAILAAFNSIGPQLSIPNKMSPKFDHSSDLSN